MDRVFTAKFSLDIVTTELTAALKHLIKAERKEKVLLLRHESGNLTISLGKTSREIGATGSWLQPVSVVRRWAKALAESPNAAAITTIRFDGQKLWARVLAVPCALETDAGDPSRAQLWGSVDGELVNHVAEAWTELATSGVLTSDIRKLFDHKMRGLFSKPKRLEAGCGTFARYHVSTQEKNNLIQTGNTGDGKLWESVSHRLVRDAVAAWKCLALYGVEPVRILSVMRRRSQ